MVPSLLSKNTLFLTVVCIVFGSCSTRATIQKQNEEVFRLAEGKLGTPFESFPNTSGEYILFIQKAKSKDASTLLKFVVYQTGSNKIAIEQNFIPGYVKWITDSSIEVLSVPGTIRENENLSDYKKIFQIAPQKIKL